MNTNVTRQAVYAAIDSERDYQDSRWGATLSGDRVPGPGQSGGDRSLDEFILYIAGYTNDAVHNASHFSNTEEKLNIVRKIAGLCVVAMEQHGAPMRQLG
jgi:hypothetical protein